MAENIRKVDTILRELFRGKDSALAKYSTVRHVQYEMNLWRVHGLPLSDVRPWAKTYFARRFLGGASVTKVTESELTEGFTRLEHAVKDGCHGRCLRLVNELNEAMKELGLDTLKNPEAFLDYMTFNKVERRDALGEVIMEKPFNVPACDFYDDRNRKVFWSELESIIKSGRMMSMVDVLLVIRYKSIHSVSIK